MALPSPPSGATTASARGGVASLVAFTVLILLLSSMPLILAPPVAVQLVGPALVPVDAATRFRGRFDAASFGLAGERVDIYLDGVPLPSVESASDGTFTFEVRAVTQGPHVLTAVADAGGFTEARSGALAFRAVLAPPEPAGVAARPQASGMLVSWAAPALDEDRPVLAYRVYRHIPGAPWVEMTTLGREATTFEDATGEARHEYAVASLNVAGESAWSRA